MCMTRSYNYKSWVFVAVIIIYIVVVAITTAVVVGSFRQKAARVSRAHGI